jgi:hypothetical protein
MKSEMANKLEELLAKMSQEQFEQEWSEIEKLGMNGPSFEQMISHIELNQPLTGSFEYSKDLSVEISGEDEFYLAA